MSEIKTLHELPAAIFLPIWFVMQTTLITSSRFFYTSDTDKLNPLFYDITKW
jgi:hypothetical protein